MIRLAIAALLVTLLAGCPRLIVRPDPIPAQCDVIGFEVCKSEAKWEGDPNDAATWDKLGQDTLNESRDETRTCEVRRKALEQCLRRLEREKVIVL